MEKKKHLPNSKKTRAKNSRQTKINITTLVSGPQGVRYNEAKAKHERRTHDGGWLVPGSNPHPREVVADLPPIEAGTLWLEVTP